MAPPEGWRAAEQITLLTSSGQGVRPTDVGWSAYFETDSANNGGTEAINGFIELHRRIARGVPNRDTCRLRMVPSAEASTHGQLKYEEPDY